MPGNRSEHILRGRSAGDMEKGALKTICSFVWLLMLVLIPAETASAIDSVSIAATKRSIQNFERVTSGKTAADIEDFSAKHCTRQIVDMILVLKALKIAGHPDVKIVFHEVPNSARERAMVKSGKVVLGENDSWKLNFDDTVFMTDPIIRDGEFEKGIYIDSNSSNNELRHASSLKALQKFSAVMVPTWYVDWETLKAMNPKKLHGTATAVSIFRMLRAGRADFTLYEFSHEKDFGRVLEGIRLIPVPGIKVGLSGSRHLMVSKIHPKGQSVFSALQKGLKALRNQGVISRALTECGFLDRRVANWKRLN